jgi:type III secretory pathway lipoprotein EscJ
VRLLASLILAALVPSLGGCDAELYHDLPERRANEALLALREAGLAADKRLEQRGTSGRSSLFTLTVPRSDEAQALRVLEQRGLPRLPPPPPSGSSRLLGLPGEQRSDEAARLEAALVETLERLPMVEEARVHLGLPAPEPLSPVGQLRPTAAVLLRLRAALVPKPAEIAELVARAVPGLDAADVAVIATPAAPAMVLTTGRRGAPLWALGALGSAIAVLLAGCGLLLLRLRRSAPDERPEPTQPAAGSGLSRARA